MTRQENCQEAVERMLINLILPPYTFMEQSCSKTTSLAFHGRAEASRFRERFLNGPVSQPLPSCHCGLPVFCRPDSEFCVLRLFTSVALVSVLHCLVCQMAWGRLVVAGECLQSSGDVLLEHSQVQVTAVDVTPRVPQSLLTARPSPRPGPSTPLHPSGHRRLLQPPATGAERAPLASVLSPLPSPAPPVLARSISLSQALCNSQLGAGGLLSPAEQLEG